MRIVAPVYYSADMVRAMPDDGNRYETVFGELVVSPAPRPWHQVVHARLFAELAIYLRAQPVGVVLSSPADLSFGRDDVLVQPDLWVVKRDEIRQERWDRIGRLLLAIEILSPSSARYDRFAKRRLYQQIGADEYWVVDGERAFIEVWKPEDVLPTVVQDVLHWLPGGASEPLVLEVAPLLAREA